MYRCLSPTCHYILRLIVFYYKTKKSLLVCESLLGAFFIYSIMSSDPLTRFKIKIAYEKGFYLGIIIGLLIAMLLSSISFFFL